MNSHTSFLSKHFIAGGLALFLAFVSSGSLHAYGQEADSPAFQTTPARIAVEHAWEAYHHAALGGTLASPEIQSELEMSLHQSRALLAQAYSAEEKGDLETVRRLVDDIMKLTRRVITESQESKQ